MHDQGDKTSRISLKNKQKTIALVAILGLIGVILIYVSNNYSKINDSDYKDREVYEAQIEKKLEDFLLEIEGISSVRVIVTIDYAKAHDDTYTFADVSSDTEQLFRSVRGVAIACTNGDDYKVKMKLTELVTAYLGISSNRIEIVDIK